MAMTPQQLAELDAADQKAQADLVAAEAKQHEIMTDALTERALRDGPAAALAVAAARNHANQARAALKAANTQQRLENKPTSARDAAIVKEEAEKDANAAKPGGIRETDAENKKRLEREAALAVRQNPRSTPAQDQNANTNATNATNTGIKNANADELGRIKAQIEALEKAGIQTITLRGQISKEEADRQDREIKRQDAARTAAGALVTAQTTEREQDMRHIQARGTFMGNVLTTVMPQVAKMMMDLPKGSPIAANFLKGFMVMADSAYTKAGLDKDVPRLDRNSPEWQQLSNQAGWKGQVPPEKTADQITWSTVKTGAVLGMPTPGSQLPIGPRALDTPDDPKSVAAAGGKVDDQALMNELAASEEGKAMAAKLQEENKDLLAIPPDKRTPEQTAQVNALAATLKQQLTSRAAELKVQRAGPPPSADDKFKQGLRGILTDPDSDSKLNMMSAVVAGQQNKAEGKPLTTEQQILLSNLDPEDLAIIQQSMPPDVLALVQRHKSGATLSDTELQYIKSKMGAASEQIKARQITPKPPTAPVINPNQGTVQATMPTNADGTPKPLPIPLLSGPQPVVGETPAVTPSASTAATPDLTPTPAQNEAMDQQEAAEVNSLSADERAMYKQVQSQRTQDARANPGSLPRYDRAVNTARDAVRRGERAKPEFYDTPPPTPMSSQAPTTNDIPNLGSMFKFDQGETSPAPIASSQPIPMLNPDMIKYAGFSNPYEGTARDETDTGLDPYVASLYDQGIPNFAGI